METRKIRRKAFISGYRRVFDPYNDFSRDNIKSSCSSDKKNLINDWANVGNELRKATREYETKRLR